jgi:multicomponent Na+:H+ antiporter subunit D
VLVTAAMIFSWRYFEIGRAIAGHRPDGLVVVAFLLIITGFLIKGASVPFHFWLADAHAVAPTPACVLFTGVMVELRLYGIARVYWPVFGGPADLNWLRLVRMCRAPDVGDTTTSC